VVRLVAHDAERAIELLEKDDAAQLVRQARTSGASPALPPITNVTSEHPPSMSASSRRASPSDDVCFASMSSATTCESGGIARRRSAPSDANTRSTPFARSRSATSTTSTDA
jgi:hypothetical protein